MGIIEKTARVCNLFSTLHLHSPPTPEIPPEKTLYAYSNTYIHYTLVVHRYILYVKLKLINWEQIIVDGTDIEDDATRKIEPFVAHAWKRLWSEWCVFPLLFGCGRQFYRKLQFPFLSLGRRRKWERRRHERERHERDVEARAARSVFSAARGCALPPSSLSSRTLPQIGYYVRTT